MDAADTRAMKASTSSPAIGEMSICVLAASAMNCGSFMVAESAARSASRRVGGIAGRRDIDAAERLRTEDQAKHLPVLLGLGVVVDVRNVVELDAACARRVGCTGRKLPAS